MVFLVASIVEGTFPPSTLPILEVCVLIFTVITILCSLTMTVIDMWIFYNQSGRRFFRILDARCDALQYIGSRNYAAAATVYEDSEQYEAAVEQWLEAQDYNRASNLMISKGFFNRAVYELSENSDGVAAAKLYEKYDQGLNAAYEYEKVGKYDIASKLFVDLERYYDAARCFRKNHKYREAAHYYEKEWAFSESAKAIIDYLQSLEYQNTPENPDLVRELKLKAAGFLAQSFAYEHAAQLYEEEGYFQQAGENYQAANLLQQASHCYRRAGNLRLSADLQEQIGDQAKALITRAEAAVAERDYVQAANLFSAAELPHRAGQYYEKAQMWEAAAQQYERSNDLDLAQAAYAQLEDYSRAGRIAEKRKDFAAAARFYKESGDLDAQVRVHKLQGNLSQSAKILLELRRLEEADQLINKMNSSDPNTIQTLEELGDILRERGRLEEAYSRYRAAVGNKSIGPQTINLYKKMSEVLAESDELASAQSLIEKILLFKPDDSASIELLSRIDQLRLRRKENSLRTKTAEEPQPQKGSVKDLFPSSSDNESRYEIVDEIARGGMGVVYRAKDRFLDRIIALKLLNETFAQNEVAIQYFVREARAAAALNHPGIVTIFDVGQQRGQVFMAMELIDGTTLKHYIRHKGTLSESQIIWIIIQCCTALDYAHSKGIIHRDIKSGNVMLTRDKSLKIMDFGLAKAIQNHQGEHTQLIGTPYYMSPEQVSGVNVDFRSDLYSLGCMIYECATGRVPFKEGEPAYHHVHTLPTPPIERNPHISPKLNDFILRLLEKKPENRFQSAADCLEFVKAM